MLNVNSGRDTLELLVRSVIAESLLLNHQMLILNRCPFISAHGFMKGQQCRSLRNPDWGCPRIAQQMALAFHIQIEKDVVRSILARHYRPPTQIQPKQFKEMEENALKES